tara:strand:- start:605 stop:943 length:339 start_codon:yes stop_codon:yes gene_type:complete
MMQNDIRQLQEENDLLVVANQVLRQRVAALEDQNDRFEKALHKLSKFVHKQAGKQWVLFQLMSTEHAWTLQQITVLVRALEPREGWAYRQLVEETTKSEAISQTTRDESDAI